MGCIFEVGIVALAPSFLSFATWMHEIGKHLLHIPTVMCVCYNRL